LSSGSRIALVVVLVSAAVFGALFWLRRPQPPVAAPPAPVAAPAPPAPPVPPQPPPEAPAIRHPVASGAPPGAVPGLDDSDGFIKNAIADLVGHKSSLSLLVFDGFARRFVATVNNLATDSASAQLWPVARAEGRFTVEAPRTGDGAIIAPTNDARYAAFVAFVDAIDAQRAVALYTRLYPLFQRAYEDLGFPGKYFNDRVVEVIDNLLATPDVAARVKVRLITVDGAAPSAGTGRLYVFADPALESSTVGQKILLRVGPENARKLKAKLASVRRHLLGDADARAIAR